MFPWPTENGKHPHAILHSVCVSSLIYFVFSFPPSVSVWWSFVYRTVAHWRGCLEVVTPLMSSMIHGRRRGNTRLCLFDLPHQRLATFWDVSGLKWHKRTAVDSFYFVTARKSCTKRLPWSWNRSQPTLGPPWRGCWYITGMRQEPQERCLWHGDKAKIL